MLLQDAESASLWWGGGDLWLHSTGHLHGLPGFKSTDISDGFGWHFFHHSVTPIHLFSFWSWMLTLCPWPVDPWRASGLLEKGKDRLSPHAHEEVSLSEVQEKGVGEVGTLAMFIFPETCIVKKLWIQDKYLICKIPGFSFYSSRLRENLGPCHGLLWLRTRGIWGLKGGGSKRISMTKGGTGGESGCQLSRRQHFLHFDVCLSHLGIWLKCTFSSMSLG